MVIREQIMAERLNQMKETHMRSVVKGLMYRVLGSLCTVIVAYIFTREKIISIEIGGLEFLAKVFLYYTYERAWNFVGWGRTASANVSQTEIEI